MSGKICYDEIPRIKKLARLDCIQMPAFMRNQEKYKKTLKQIAHMNGLHLEHAKFKAPLAYLRRLKKGRRIGVAKGSKKVRKKGKKGSMAMVKGEGAQGKGGSENTFGQLGSDEDDDSDLNDEDGFYFQQYSMSTGSNDENFFEAMKKSMERNSSGKISDGSESFSYSYFKSLVNKYEKSTADPPPSPPQPEDSREGIIDSLFTAPSESSSKRELKDWENDCVKSGYRCVSRASVHFMMSLPSNSLSSRRKNSSSDPIAPSLGNGFVRRPLSSIVPGRRATMESSLDDKLAESRNQSRLSKVPTTSSSSSINLASQPDVSCTDSNPSPQEHSNQSCTNHNNQAHSATSEKCMRKTVDGFIYPDSDVLTEDMIRVNTALQLSDTNRGQNCSVAGPPKLLHRRVKSAANSLPSKY